MRRLEKIPKLDKMAQYRAIICLEVSTTDIGTTTPTAPTTTAVVHIVIRSSTRVNRCRGKKHSNICLDKAANDDVNATERVHAMEAAEAATTVTAIVAGRDERVHPHPVVVLTQLLNRCPVLTMRKKLNQRQRPCAL